RITAGSLSDVGPIHAGGQYLDEYFARAGLGAFGLGDTKHIGVACGLMIDITHVLSSLVAGSGPVAICPILYLRLCSIARDALRDRSLAKSGVLHTWVWVKVSCVRV